MLHTTRRMLLKGGAAGAAVLAAPRRIFAQGEQPVRIGVAIALSGPQALNGSYFHNGALIAADLINRKGGVLGRKLELVIRDDKASANDAVFAARDIISGGTNLLIGGVFTHTALATIPIATQEKAVFGVLGGVANSITHENFSRNMFRLATNAHTQYRAQARLMAERYPDVLKWGAIIPDLEYGHAGWSAFSNGLRSFYPEIVKKNCEINEAVLTKFGATDYKPQIARLMSQGIEGVYSGLSGADLTTMLTQSQAMGLAPRLKVFNDVGIDLFLGKAMGPNTPNNAWSSTTWYYGSPDPNELSKTLYKEYVERTKDTIPLGLASNSFNLINIFAKAVETAKSTETPAVIEALENGTFETTSGSLRFRKEDHQAITRLTFVKMGPKPGEPGWGVLDTANFNSQDFIEPPSPGVPFKD